MREGFRRLAQPSNRGQMGPIRLCPVDPRLCPIGPRLCRPWSRMCPLWSRWACESDSIPFARALTESGATRAAAGCPACPRFAVMVRGPDRGLFRGRRPPASFAGRICPICPRFAVRAAAPWHSMCPQCSRLGGSRHRDCPVCSRFPEPWRESAPPSLCPICPRFAGPPRDSRLTGWAAPRRAVPSGGSEVKCGQMGHSRGHFLHKRGQTGHRAAGGLRPAGCHRPTAPPIVPVGEEG